MEKYAQITENVKKVYRYICTKDDRIESDHQCEYVRPIAFALLDGDVKKGAISIWETFDGIRAGYAEMA